MKATFNTDNKWKHHLCILFITDSVVYHIINKGRTVYFNGKYILYNFTISYIQLVLLYIYYRFLLSQSHHKHYDAEPQFINFYILLNSHNIEKYFKAVDLEYILYVM